MNLFSVNIHTFQENRFLLENGFLGALNRRKSDRWLIASPALVCSVMIFTVILTLSHHTVSANVIHSAFWFQKWPYPAHRAVVRSVSNIFCFTLLYSALLCFTPLYTALLCSTLLYTALLCFTLLYSALSALLCSTLLYSALLCSNLLYSA